MDKKDQRYSEYLFAKMGSRNNSLEHVVVNKDTKENHNSSATKPTIAQTKTESLHYSSKKDTDDEQSQFVKWLLDNLMLLVTLSGVVLGVIIGE